MIRSSVSDWIDRVRGAERSGNLIAAYDLAMQGLVDHPDSRELHYLATRALARSGATGKAAALYRHFRLDREADTDIASLGARLAKDQALIAPTRRRQALRAAAAAYAKIHARTREHYPAINAATLYLLANDQKRALRFAQRAREACERDAGGSALDRYYRLATQAEAALICRDCASAQQALQEAAAHLNGHFDAAATTRKQLRMVCRATGTDPDILDVLRPPAVLHYAAPAWASPAHAQLLTPARARAFRRQIEDFVVRRGIGYAYGSLAAGGEILCAEACLQADIELHVVLPFNQAEFVAQMVRPVGGGWLRRFNACLGRAKVVTFATTDSYQGDHELYGYAGRLAMGMAMLRGRHLDTDTLHADIQTGGWRADPRGYDANLRLWQARGHASQVLKPAMALARVEKRAAPRASRSPPRVSRALLYGDIKGSSRTPDYLIPFFYKHLMGAIARVLRRYDRHVLYRNSWGDAIYAVIDDPIVAAECCLAIQDALGKADLARHGLPAEMTLRLAAHFGPVYDGRDPIRGERMFFGSHTVLAARMEPVTAPGQVYVTEAMAAAIAMTHEPRFRTEYVGNIAMPKGFGTARMYALNGVVGGKRGKRARTLAGEN